MLLCSGAGFLGRASLLALYLLYTVSCVLHVGPWLCLASEHLCGGCRFGGDLFIRSCLGASVVCAPSGVAVWPGGYGVRQSFAIAIGGLRLAVLCVVVWPRVWRVWPDFSFLRAAVASQPLRVFVACVVSVSDCSPFLLRTWTTGALWWR